MATSVIIPSRHTPTPGRNARIFSVLLACFVVLTPLNNCYEVAAMMMGTLSASESAGTAWTTVLTPIYIKAIKDIFLVLSALLLATSLGKSFGRTARRFATRPLFALNAFCLIVAVCALYSFTVMPATVVLMGIRGYWTIILVYVGASYCDFDERRIYPGIIAVFCLHLMLQLAQGLTDVGYNVYFEHRSPGIFIIPATAGAFALLAHYVGIRVNSILLKAASVVSLLLSNSTTGLLILIAYYIYICRGKFRYKLVYYPVYTVVAAGVACWIWLNLGWVSGRGEGASYSAVVRLGLLYAAVSDWNNLLFGHGMGIATSQALLSGTAGAVIADNTYVGLLYNAGALPALLMLGFVSVSFRYFENKLLFFLLLGYSMTTVIFELNPVIQIVLVLLGAHMMKGYAASVDDVKGASATALAPRTVTVQ